MTTLAQTQAALQRALCGDDCGIESLVVSDGCLGARERLAIYSQAVVARLVGALAEGFPAVRQAQGAARFDRLAREYVAGQPSRSASIRWFGRDFAAFLDSRGRTPSRRGLAELAHWEWTLSLAFDAANARPIDERALAAFAPADWGRLRIRFVPSLQRVDLSTNVLEWWRAATQGAARPGQWRRVNRAAWVVWRPDLVTSFRSLAPDEAICVDLAARGATFAELCERLASAVGVADAPVRAATLLKSWITEGWIAGIERA